MLHLCFCGHFVFVSTTIILVSILTFIVCFRYFRENEALWREVAILRQKHMKQQTVLNKV